MPPSRSSVWSLRSRISPARAWSSLARSSSAAQYSLARAQFQYLLTQSPPEETRAVIERYLGAINDRSQLAGSRWSALAQFGAGYDSNANGSTSEQTFLGFTLEPEQRRDGVVLRRAAARRRQHAWRSGAQSGLISNLQVTHRANPDASFIDQTVASLGTGFVWAPGATRFNVGADGYAGWLDGEDHERGVNLNLGVVAPLRRLRSRRSACAAARSSTSSRHCRSSTQTAISPALSLTRLNIGSQLGPHRRSRCSAARTKRKPGRLALRQRPLRRAAFASWLLRPQSSVYRRAVASMSIGLRRHVLRRRPQGRSARRHRRAGLPELPRREMERRAARSLHEERFEHLALRVRPRRSGHLHPAQLLSGSTQHEHQTHHPPRQHAAAARSCLLWLDARCPRGRRQSAVRAGSGQSRAQRLRAR